MIQKINVVLFVFTLVFLSSCEKEELPLKSNKTAVTETDPNSSNDSVFYSVKSNSIFIDTDYKYQVFYDLESDTKVAQNLKTDWDLAFECGDNGYHIKLNSSRGMQVWATGVTNFSTVESISDNAVWTWDNPNGHLDSTSIAEWGTKNGSDIISKNQVFVLDLGYRPDGSKIGYRRMQLLSQTDNSYKVKFSHLSGEDEFTKVVQKDNDYNFMFLLIDKEGSLVSIEPPKNNWDLLFTQYTQTFISNNISIPYTVTGVLINPNSTFVHLDTVINFDNMVLEQAKYLEFNTNQNTIGYDWKTYNYDSGSYIIHPEMNYVIKNRVGNYYQLHFIDFYNENGQKGHIKFEFQRL
tara:strand:+ start:3936 stop:4988 length:1053 start_codon:yes stop_codon:yes gene_type:complete